MRVSLWGSGIFRDRAGECLRVNNRSIIVHFMAGGDEEGDAASERAFQFGFDVSC